MANPNKNNLFRNPAVTRGRSQLIDRHYRQLSGQLRTLFRQHVRECASRVERGLLVLPMDYTTRWSEQTDAVRRPVLYSAAIAGADKADAELKTTGLGRKSAGGIALTSANSFFTESYRKRVDDWLKQVSSSVTRRNAEKIQRLHDKAATYFDKEKQRGLTPKEVAKEIMKLDVEYTKKRANMIAFTDTAYAFNSGLREEFRAEGYTVFEWFTSVDDSVCPLCVAMDGVKVAGDDPFWKRGDTAEVDVLGSDGVSSSHTMDIQHDIQHPPLHPWCACSLIPSMEQAVTASDKPSRAIGGVREALPPPGEVGATPKEFLAETEVDAWSNLHFGKWRDNLSMEEKFACSQVGGASPFKDDVIRFDNYLRWNKVSGSWSEADMKKTIGKLDYALMRSTSLTPEDVTMFSTLENKEVFDKGVEAGQMFFEKSYLRGTWTRSKAIAEYTKDEAALVADKIFMEVRVPKNMPILNVDALKASVPGGEGQVLLKRNIVFRVVEDKGIIEINGQKFRHIVYDVRPSNVLGKAEKVPLTKPPEGVGKTPPPKKKPKPPAPAPEPPKEKPKPPVETPKPPPADGKRPDNMPVYRNVSEKEADKLISKLNDPTIPYSEPYKVHGKPLPDWEQEQRLRRAVVDAGLDRSLTYVNLQEDYVLKNQVVELSEILMSNDRVAARYLKDTLVNGADLLNDPLENRLVRFEGKLFSLGMGTDTKLVAAWLHNGKAIGATVVDLDKLAAIIRGTSIGLADDAYYNGTRILYHAKPKPLLDRALIDKDIPKFATAEQYADYMQKVMPNVKFDYSGISAEGARAASEGIIEGARAHPEVLRKLEYVGTHSDRSSPVYKDTRRFKWGSSTHAHASNDGTYIGINPSVYSDYQRMKASTERSAEITRWHPEGTGNPKSITSHEFGHMVHHLFRYKNGATIFDSDFSAVEEGLRVIAAWSEKHRPKRMRFLSAYAKSDEFETFAEAFSQRMCADRSKWHPATAELDKLLDDVFSAWRKKQ